MVLAIAAGLLATSLLGTATLFVESSGGSGVGSATLMYDSLTMMAAVITFGAYLHTRRHRQVGRMGLWLGTVLWWGMTAVFVTLAPVLVPAGVLATAAAVVSTRRRPTMV